LEGEKTLPQRTKSREQNNSVGSLHAKRGQQKETPTKKNQGRKRHSREQTLGAKSSANMGAPRRETKTNEEKQGKGRRDLSPLHLRSAAML
jgi:hypothetical protein